MDDISPAPVDLPVANEVENVEINKILYGVIDRVHGLSAIPTYYPCNRAERQSAGLYSTKALVDSCFKKVTLCAL